MKFWACLRQVNRGHPQQQPTKGGRCTLLSEGNFDEVNFWQPSGDQLSKLLKNSGWIS